MVSDIEITTAEAATTSAAKAVNASIAIETTAAFDTTSTVKDEDEATISSVQTSTAQATTPGPPTTTVSDVETTTAAFHTTSTYEDEATTSSTPTSMVPQTTTLSTEVDFSSTTATSALRLDSSTSLIVESTPSETPSVTVQGPPVGVPPSGVEAEAIIGSATTAAEMEQLSVLPLGGGLISSYVKVDSIEQGLLSLLFEGEASVNVEAVLSLHFMEQFNCVKFRQGCNFEYVKEMLEENLAFEVNYQKDGTVSLAPTDEVLERCPTNSEMPTLADAFPESCISRLDVDGRRMTKTAVEVPPSGYDKSECIDFMGYMLPPENASAAEPLGRDFSELVASEYEIDGALNRGVWVNPGYQWAPVFPGEDYVFYLSQKVVTVALVSLNDGRRTLLASSGNSVTDVAQAVEFNTSPETMIASVFGVDLKLVATFKFVMFLQQDEVCMKKQNARRALLQKVTKYVLPRTTPHETVQAPHLEVDANAECTSATSASGRKLLGLSNATAEVQVIVVFSQGEMPAMDVDEIVRVNDDIIRIELLRGDIDTSPWPDSSDGEDKRDDSDDWNPPAPKSAQPVLPEKNNTLLETQRNAEFPVPTVLIAIGIAAFLIGTAIALYLIRRRNAKHLDIGDERISAFLTLSDEPGEDWRKGKDEKSPAAKDSDVISDVLMLNGELDALDRVRRADSDRLENIRHEMVSAVLMVDGAAPQSSLLPRSSWGLNDDDENFADKPAGWMVSAVLQLAGDAGFKKGAQHIDPNQLEAVRQAMVSAALFGGSKGRGILGDELYIERTLADKGAIEKPLGDMVSTVLMLAADAEGRFIDGKKLEQLRSQMVSAVLMLDGPGGASKLGDRTFGGPQLEEKLAEQSGDYMVSAVLMMAADKGLKSEMQQLDGSKLGQVRRDLVSAMMHGGARGLNELNPERLFADATGVQLPPAGDKRREMLEAALLGGGIGLNGLDLERLFADATGVQLPPVGDKRRGEMLEAALLGGGIGLNGLDLERLFADATGVQLPPVGDKRRCEMLEAALLGGGTGRGLNGLDLERLFADVTRTGFKLPASADKRREMLEAALIGGAHGLNGLDLERLFADATRTGFQVPPAVLRREMLEAALFGGATGRGLNGLDLEGRFADVTRTGVKLPASADKRREMLEAALLGGGTGRGLNGLDLERRFADATRTGVKLPASADKRREMLEAALFGGATGRGLNGLDLEGRFADATRTGVELPASADKRREMLEAALFGGAAARGLDALALEGRLADTHMNGFHLPAAGTLRREMLEAALFGGAQGLNGLDLEALFADVTRTGVKLPASADKRREMLEAALMGGSTGRGLNGLDLEGRFADVTRTGVKLPASADKRREMLEAALLGGGTGRGLNGLDLERRFADATRTGVKLPASADKRREMLEAALFGGATGRGLNGLDLEGRFADATRTGVKLPASADKRREMLEAALFGGSAARGLDALALEGRLADTLMNGFELPPVGDKRREMLAATLLGGGAGRGLNGLDLEALFADVTRTGVKLPASADKRREMLEAALMGGSTGRGLNGLDLERLLADVTRTGVNIPATDDKRREMLAVTLLGGGTGRGLNGLDLEGRFADATRTGVNIPAADDKREMLEAAILGGGTGRGLNGLDLEGRFANTTRPRFELPSAADKPRNMIEAAIMGGSTARGLGAMDLESRLADAPTRSFELPKRPERRLSATLLGGVKGQGPTGLQLEQIFADKPTDKPTSSLEKPISNMVSAVLMLAAEAGGARTIDSEQLGRMHQEIVSAVLDGRSKAQGLDAQAMEERMTQTPASREDMISQVLMLAAQTDQLDGVKKIHSGKLDEARREMVSAMITFDGPGKANLGGLLGTNQTNDGSKVVQGLIIEERLAEQVGTKPFLDPVPEVSAPGMVSAMITLDGPATGHYSGPLGQFGQKADSKAVHAMIEEKLAGQPDEEAKPWTSWLGGMVSAVLMLDDGHERSNVTRIDSAQLETPDQSGEVRVAIHGAGERSAVTSTTVDEMV